MPLIMTFKKNISIIDKGCNLLHGCFFFSIKGLREAFKKNIESVSMLIFRGGGEGVLEPALPPP